MQPDNPLQRAEALVAKGELREAEREYRRAIERDPRSPLARRGLARVLLWRLRVDEAEALFTELLRENPNNLDAREGVATIAYWRGDSATAARELRTILQADPARESARALLRAIEEASDPRYGVEASVLDDDQPLRRSTARIDGSGMFGDAVRLEGTALVESFEREAATDETFALEVAAETYLRSLQSRVAAHLKPFRFPNGDTALLGGASLSRRHVRSQSTIAFGTRRDEILETAAALDSQATVRRAFLSWTMDRSDGWLAGANVERLDYFDQNEGFGANGYLLAPIHRTGETSAWAGLGGAYRDTDEARFRLVRFHSEPRSGGGFLYRYEGVYDPYWTPHDLREARAILVAERRQGPWSAKIQIDAGIAQDEAIGFGPAAGTTPLPPAIAPVLFARNFHPWRVSTSISRMLGSLQLELVYERNVTVFYTSNEYQARLARRF